MTTSNGAMDIRAIMQLAPVIPVLKIEDADKAVPLARALVAGGLPVLEITLRTATAMRAVEAIIREVPDAVVGVGTVLRPEDLLQAEQIGAQFAVSPGLTSELADAARYSAIAFLPGVMTPGEVMYARGHGFTSLKLFPAMQAGGVPMLQALAGPFPDLIFCPTGGVKAETCRDFLALPNVACVGGSWLAPADAVAAGDWARIERLAAASVSHAYGEKGNG